jgi:hypothetical protein
MQLCKEQDIECCAVQVDTKLSKLFLWQYTEHYQSLIFF